MKISKQAATGLFFCLCLIATGQEKQTDIEYGRAGEHALLLDLYLPTGVENPQLIVWVHGGAWRSGSKDSMPLTSLVNEYGYAIASVDYRLSPVARFPAQVHDIKAAIRFLRAKADHFGYRADKIVIAGNSAGGHLAALVGVSNGHAELEGDAGDFDDESSDVNAIVSYYGMSNFHTILKQSTPHGLSVREPALTLLLGGLPDQKPALATLASATTHVGPGDPPLLLIHGDQDPQAPINQSHELHGLYQSQQLLVDFHVIHGAAHGGEEFYDAERTKLVADFLKVALSVP